MDPYLIRWTRSYLVGRSRFVCVDGCDSRPLPPLSGVTQSSVLLNNAELLAAANVPPLQKRHIQLSLCHLSKIVNSLTDFPASPVFPPDHFHKTRSSDLYCLSLELVPTSIHYFQTLSHYGTICQRIFLCIPLLTLLKDLYCFTYNFWVHFLFSPLLVVLCFCINYYRKKKALKLQREIGEVDGALLSVFLAYFRNRKSYQSSHEQSVRRTSRKTR